MRAATLSLFLAALTLTGATSLFACGGGGATVGTNDVDAATPETDGGGIPPGPGADASASTDAANSADANTADAAADTRIDPIDLGRSWTYDVTIIGTYPLCKAGSHVGQVLGSKVVGGKASFQVQSFCPGAGTSSYAVDGGDKVEIYYANTWVLSLDAPVAEGHTWTDGVNSYSWEKVGQSTVPDGTFDDCWKVKPSVGTSFTTLCRGVGPVSWHFVGADGNGYDAQLTAHTL